MSEQFNEKIALDKFRQWHFWWLVVFSFLLIMTFVYYLPTKFLQQAQKAESMPHTHPGEMPMFNENQSHTHDATGNAIPLASSTMAPSSASKTNQEEAEGKMIWEKLQAKQVTCADLSNDDFDVLGDYFMGKMMGASHESMNVNMTQTMGEDNSTLVHISIGKRFSGCDTNAPYPASGENVMKMMNVGSSGDGSSSMDHNMMMGPATNYEEANIKEGLAVNLNISPVPYNVGVPLSMNFFVNEKPGNLPTGQAGIPVLANKLQVEHEKLMHVIGVRSDMNEFFHIHPEFLADSPSVFSIDHTFQGPGLYKIWSEVKKDGVNYVFGHPEISVNGSGLREEKKVSFSRNVITGNYQVSLKVSDTVVKAKAVDLSFDIHTLTGQEVEVEKYLGADMHLSIIKDDLSQFIHTHPVRSHARAKGASPEDLGRATSYGTHPGGSEAEHSHSRAPQVINVALAHGGEEPAGATDEHQTTPSMGSGQTTTGDQTIDFNVIFPEAGLYKAFAQFRPKGIDLPAEQALIAEFWIQVEEKTALPISQWWMLLLVSVVLIAGLSWWVNNYLKVKPEDVQIKK